MKLLREISQLPLFVSAFRLVAILEALSWAGLLTGMLFKYILTPHGEPGETLVTVFGAVHGGLVIFYVALAGLLALQLRWPLKTFALAFVATIPPFATLAFDRWAKLAGHYRLPGEVETTQTRAT